ncbi:MAG: ABC transporter ATP-binding protein [Planctomycetota bacterium]|jgi:lipoprotein-releasing system ATP-binding protein
MSETATQPALMSADDLHKTYRLGRVDVPVLKGTTLNVVGGEWLAILGASGTGKSTLLHLLGDLDQPDTGCGAVSFGGRTLSALSLGERNHYRNRLIGFVFQFYHLLPELNVLENTLLPALVGLHRWTYYGRIGALRGKATALLESFGLGHRLKHRPRELSGGERQRVAIARALMNDPKVLLADEPTGNLDETTGAEILDLIAQQHQAGLTIVMVTHDSAIAQRADRVVRLHDGRIS